MPVCVFVVKIDSVENTHTYMKLSKVQILSKTTHLENLVDKDYSLNTEHTFSMTNDMKIDRAESKG